MFGCFFMDEFPMTFLEALPDEAGEALLRWVGYDVETTKT